MIRLGIPQIGGPEWRGGLNWLINLCELLVSRGSGRIVPVVFARPDLDPTDAARFGVEVVRGSAMMGAASPVRALLTGRDAAAVRTLKAARIDVLLENARFTGWRTGLPTIAWLPDLQHRRMPQLFGRAARLRRDLGFRLQIATGRTLLLSSETARDDVVRFYSPRPAALHVARFAVPPPTAEERAGAAGRVARYDLPERFLFLPNQFWVHKNHAVVVDALRLLAERGEPPTVAVVGHGDDPRAPGHRAGVEAAVDRHGLAGSFRMLGVVPYADVRALMIEAHALLNPSRFEGWSTTVEEAKAAGTATILSDIDVHREQAADARFFGVDDRSALATAMTNALAAPRGRPDDAASWARVDAFLRAVEGAVDAALAAA